MDLPRERIVASVALLACPRLARSLMSERSSCELHLMLLNELNDESGGLVSNKHLDNIII
jgi:hypothetical protein